MSGVGNSLIHCEALGLQETSPYKRCRWLRNIGGVTAGGVQGLESRLGWVCQVRTQQTGSLRSLLLHMTPTILPYAAALSEDVGQSTAPQPGGETEAGPGSQGQAEHVPQAL